jgi:hypothetical protein
LKRLRLRSTKTAFSSGAPSAYRKKPNTRRHVLHRLHRRGHLRRRHRRRRLSLRRRHRLHRLHRLSRHEGTSTNLVEKVTPLAEAVGKNLVEKGTPLAEAVGKNGLTNAGTLVATGIVRGAGLLAAATICSTLITSRGLKKPR